MFLLQTNIHKHSCTHVYIREMEERVKSVNSRYQWIKDNFLCLVSFKHTLTNAHHKPGSACENTLHLGAVAFMQWLENWITHLLSGWQRSAQSFHRCLWSLGRRCLQSPSGSHWLPVPRWAAGASTGCWRLPARLDLWHIVFVSPCTQEWLSNFTEDFTVTFFFCQQY